jgi:hypothetical protein
MLHAIRRETRIKHSDRRMVARGQFARRSVSPLPAAATPV